MPRSWQLRCWLGRQRPKRSKGLKSGVAPRFLFHFSAGLFCGDDFLDEMRSSKVDRLEKIIGAVSSSFFFVGYCLLIFPKV